MTHGPAPERQSDALHTARTDPVILLGRGGGGTRLLSEGVSGLGVFMGNRLNVSYDSVEWVKTIYELSIRRWGTVPTEADLETTAGPKQLCAQAALILNERAIAPSQPWGWKLPETTLIAPMVRHAFPHARFIHLVRHPVTTCCRRSHMTSRNDTPLGIAALNAACRFIGRKPALIETDPQHIKNAASWAFQADIMVRFFESDLFAHPALTLKYENICSTPQTVMQTLATYLDLPFQTDKMFPVDPARAAGSDPDPTAAREVWDICKFQAIQFGYGALPNID